MTSQELDTYSPINRIVNTAVDKPVDNTAKGSNNAGLYQIAQ